MTVLFGDWGWGNVIPADLRLDGFSGIGRYSSDDGSKCFNAAERDRFIPAGFSVELFAENGAMCLGAPAGDHMGRVALGLMQRLGAPPGMGHYLAEDYDSQPGDWPAVAAALDAFRNVLHAGGYLGGFYGKAALGEQMCKDGHVDQVPEGNFLFHQTEAWSGRYISPIAAAYQQAKQVTVDGVQVDIDVLLAVNIGQWPQPSNPPASWKVQPMYSPPLRPIVCSTPIQGGGVLAIADDGSSYYLNPPPNYPEHTGMNVDPKDWTGRTAAEVRILEQYPNKPFTIKDTIGESYDCGYLQGQSPLRW